jgi:hypothetical protein
MENFLASWETISLSQMTLLHWLNLSVCVHVHAEIYVKFCFI